MRSKSNKYYKIDYFLDKVLNSVFYKSSDTMAEVPDNSVDLIVTSPPYFNVKDYSKDGYQNQKHSESHETDMGAYESFEQYLENLLKVWKACERVLKPNGKLCINVPLMPMLKKELNTHFNRHIYDLQSEIQHTILNNTQLYLMDLYVWERTNWSKKLMFGSYPYPRNFYAQNVIEFITVYVKDGKSTQAVSKEAKERSKLTQKEWIDTTYQIWRIPTPNKGDVGFGKHSALMPEEIVRRCVKLFSFDSDVVLDPFAGSGTTLKVAKEMNRNFIGYELYEKYKDLIDKKLALAKIKKK